MSGAADDVGILFPERELAVTCPDTGEPVTLTVAEPRFLPGLRLQARCRGLIAALGELASQTPGDLPSHSDVEAVLGENAEDWIAAVAHCCGRDEEWVARLADADAQALSATLWEVCAGFFIRRIVAAAAMRESRSRSAGSSTSSSGPGTAGDTAKSPAS